MNMNNYLFLAVLGLGLHSADAFGQNNEIPLRQDNPEGNKECPSVDTVVTASYDNDIVTIKSKYAVSEIDVGILNRYGEKIYSHYIPSSPHTATDIYLPPVVDTEKYALEVKYKGKTLTGFF